MTETINHTIPWAAGLFEGEGTIAVNANRVTVAIHMTDRDILERMHSEFGGQLYDMKKQEEHHKDSWKWCITRTENAMKFLEMIYPWMGQRRKARIEEARTAASNNRSNVSNKRHAEVVELRSQGLKHREIAEQLGMDRSHVSHILRGRYMVAMV